MEQSRTPPETRDPRCPGLVLWNRLGVRDRGTAVWVLGQRAANCLHCMLSGPLRQLIEVEEWTVSGGLSWLQGGSRVREGEESGCRKPGLDTTRLMAAL